MNLVGNAIKFTEKGEIVVSVEESAQGNEKTAETTTLHFSVRDTGIGIAADKQSKVFEAFSQADGTMARKYGGTGLGLAICTRLVQLMHGHIWLESEPGRGSTFHFTIQFELRDSPSAHPAPLRPSELHEMRVLIVDDNSTNCRVLTGLLTRWGMRPTATDGGKAGLQALRAAKSEGHPFPLILLDGNMPEMDGFMVAELIREDRSLAGATIMMLTFGASGGRRGTLPRTRHCGAPGQAHPSGRIVECDLRGAPEDAPTNSQSGGHPADPAGRGPWEPNPLGRRQPGEPKTCRALA